MNQTTGVIWAQSQKTLAPFGHMRYDAYCKLHPDTVPSDLSERLEHQKAFWSAIDHADDAEFTSLEREGITTLAIIPVPDNDDNHDAPDIFRIIVKEMTDDDDGDDYNASFQRWYERANEATQEIIDDVLIQLTGFDFPTLLEIAKRMDAAADAETTILKD
jgi:hypothetical protein